MNKQKTELLSRIKSIVQKLDSTADVILYGSRARGEEHPESDWDILILVDSKADLDYEMVFRHKLYELELESGQSLSVTLHNRSEWRSKHWVTPLYKNISQEGIRI